MKYHIPTSRECKRECNCKANRKSILEQEEKIQKIKDIKEGKNSKELENKNGGFLKAFKSQSKAIVI